jgi:hypothetical protein
MLDRMFHRATPALVVAITAASLVFAINSQGSDHTGHSHATASAKVKNSARARALHDRMRVLWEDHIVWTRMAIVDFASGEAAFPKTADRLLRNQTDIGNAIKPYYGRAAGRALTTLLKEHISVAVDLLTAAKAGDTAKVEAASAAWYDNSDRIAAFLSKANPRNWPARTMRSMMRKHLDDTLAEAVARLEGRADADIAAYDRIHRHILMMADALSAGIVKQFPQRF